jgi:xylan 1,4-beta-xylosidase
MFARMSGQRLAVESDRAVPLDEIVRNGVRGEPDVAAMASLDQKKLCVMVWHYHDDDIAGRDASVALTVNGLPLASGEAKLRHFRIDHEHSNSFSVWQKMGSPQQPTPDEYAQLEAASELSTLGTNAIVNVADAKMTVKVNLPRQAVSLLVFEW